jgi:hypothetical protein
VERRARYVRVRHNPINQRMHVGEIKVHGWPVTGGTPSSAAPWL